MNELHQWAAAVTPPKAQIQLSPAYIHLYHLEDDCLMALTFDYPDELCKRLFAIADKSELAGLMNLFNQERIYCELDRNSNFVIRN